MQNKWRGAGRCHTALSKLLGSISKRQDSTASPRAPSKRQRVSDDGTPPTISQKRTRSNQEESVNTSEAVMALSHASARQSWPIGGLSIGNDPLPGLDIGNGDLFQDISWDGSTLR